MSSPWIFISPTSRGIGYALTRHLLRTTSLPILASTRHSPSDTKAALLNGLADEQGSNGKVKEDLASRLCLVHIDVTDESTIQSAAERARELFPFNNKDGKQNYHLRLACALPGVLHPEKSPAQIDAAKSLESFRVNTVGPLLLIKHFSEFLPKNATQLAPSPGDDQIQLPPFATWLSMSARVGSITDNRAGGWYSYRASKTAVMSLSKSFDNYLYARTGQRALAVGYHPGTVKTDLSREFWDSTPEGKLFSPEDAAERMVDVIANMTEEKRGKCWDWKGEEVPP